MSAGYDAQLQNTSDRNTRQYSDLDLFFGKKISDNDINKITDVDNFPSRNTSADIGKLFHFITTVTKFPEQQASLENRYTSEKKDALSLTSIG